MKTTKLIDIKHASHEIDVAGKTLGRVAAEIAQLLVGKGKLYFVRHLDCGDFVNVKNAVQVKITGKKATGKIYSRYSGYPGGIRKIAYEDVQKKNPNEIIRHAVSGMLPNNKLRDVWMARLKFI